MRQAQARSNAVLGGSVRAIVAYLPAQPETLRAQIRGLKVRFACFLSEDKEETRPIRNLFISQFTQNNLNSYIELVPLPPKPNESFEWLYNKVNWAVTYYLDRHPGSEATEILLLAAPEQVAIVVALYTVAMLRGTRFAYVDSSRPLPKRTKSELIVLPSLLTWKGEPYRSSGLRKYQEGYFGSAAADFEEAWKMAGDKGLYALELLASCYDGLDRLSYKTALGNLDKLLRDENCMSRLYAMTTSDFRQRLARLRRFLHTAESHFGTPNHRKEMSVFSDTQAVKIFMKSLYTSAIRRIDHHEPEQAVLLLYRVLEIVAQSLLSQNRFDTAKFDIGRLDEPTKNRFLKALSKLGALQRSPTWEFTTTRRLGALDAWTAYLFCCYNGSYGPVSNDAAKLRFLGKMRNIVELRNKCFLEHGVTGVLESQAVEFSKWVSSLIAKHFMSLELVPANEDEILSPLKIIPAEV